MTSTNFKLKRTAAASRGFLVTARLYCSVFGKISVSELHLYYLHSRSANDSQFSLVTFRYGTFSQYFDVFSVVRFLSRVVSLNPDYVRIYQTLKHILVQLAFDVRRRAARS